MKPYLATTGALFGLLSATHLWRFFAEWRAFASDPWFALFNGLIVLVGGALGLWAWRLLRKTAAP